MSAVNNPESKIITFLKSDFFSLMKNYFKYLILFSLCFYFLFYIQNKTGNNIILMEVRYFTYILIILLFFLLNNILEIPQENLKKFVIIIGISLFISCVVNYIIVSYDKKNGFNIKLLIVLLTSFIIFLISTLVIYFLFEKNSKKMAKLVYDSFNNGIKNYFGMIVFLTIYLYFFYQIFSLYNTNSSYTDIMGPFILGVMMLFFVFCFIIFICKKLKIINRLQYLNTFIILYSLVFFFGMIAIYLFMKSLNSICVDGVSKETVNKEGQLSLFLFISIIILLWLDDSRNWHQIGYLLFIIITIFNFIAFFYFMPKYPNISLLCQWLMVEWLITFFYKKESSKNSIHYVFMKT